MTRTETLQGFVCVIAGEEAEIGLHEDGSISYYILPSKRFLEAGIKEGDDFFFDVVEDGGVVNGVIRALPATA